MWSTNLTIFKKKINLQNFNDFEFLQYSGDIDPEFNVVEVTEEAKQELAKIDNKVFFLQIAKIDNKVFFKKLPKLTTRFFLQIAKIDNKVFF